MNQFRPSILLLIPNLNFGGAQRVFHDHGVLLSERFQVTEAVFNLEHGHAFPTGNPLVSLDVPGGGGWPAKMLNFARRVRRLRALKRKRRFAASISHLSGADFVNVLSRRGEKVVLVVHGSKLHDRALAGLSGWMQNRVLLPLLYRRADRIVTVSRGIAGELAAMGVPKERIATIHNFFDPAAVRARSDEPLSDAERSIFADAPVLATVGRFHPQKNQAPLLDIFAGVKRKRPARLLLLGDGELRAELLGRAQALGLSTWDPWSGAPLRAGCDVYFLGFQANPFKYLKRASLFLLPSSWEGFPMVLGEAMACGLPVLATDCPTGPREYLAPDAEPPAAAIQSAEWGEYGVLLPMLDGAAPREQALGAWVEAVTRLLDDGDERGQLAAQGLRRIEDFTRDRIGRQWMELFDGLLSSHR